MKRIPALILFAFLVICLFIPGAVAADEGGNSVSFSLEIVYPTPTPGGGGGGGGGGSVNPPPTQEVLKVPTEAPVQPAQAPEGEAAPPSGPGANPPSGIEPGSRPAGGEAGPWQGPWYMALPAFLAANPSALFTTLLLVFGALVTYSNRKVLSLYRTWVLLYLISMTGLLWAAFVYIEGGPLSDTVFLVTSVIGINLVVHIFRYDRILIPLPAMVTSSPNQ